jgi:hypothetical protein
MLGAHEQIHIYEIWISIIKSADELGFYSRQYFDIVLNEIISYKTDKSCRIYLITTITIIRGI